jgi:2-polyprenyl-3-methyl-5-hydroxy-6-metoxy-1,4-benzoquinol methylase
VREYQKKIYDSIIPRLINKSFKRKSVLDAGCGTGDLCFWLIQKGAEVTGADISESSIRIAKKNVKKGKFLVSDILDLKGKYDMVMSMGVLHHNKKPERVFSHLAKLTKRDGRIVIGVYYKYGRIWHRIKRFIVRILAGKNTKKRVETAYKLWFRDFWKIRESVPKLTKQMDVMVADQFANPIESSHSIREVRHWFSSSGLKLDKTFVRKGFLWASGVNFY